MIFSKEQVVDGVKRALTAGEKADSRGIDVAMGLCLDDMSNRLISSSYLSSTTEAIVSGDRTVTVTGANNDLRYIFHLKTGAAENQRLLERKDPAIFLREYDNPVEPAGTPSVYTVLLSDDGKPIVKFNRPFASSDTLIIYYFADVTPDNLSRARSITPVVSGTLAYFFGIASERGIGYYSMFEKQVAMARSGDSFEARPKTTFEMSEADQGIRAAQWNLRRRRS